MSRFRMKNHDMYYKITHAYNRDCAKEILITNNKEEAFIFGGSRLDEHITYLEDLGFEKECVVKPRRYKVKGSSPELYLAGYHIETVESPVYYNPHNPLAYSFVRSSKVITRTEFADRANAMEVTDQGDIDLLDKAEWLEGEDVYEETI